MTQVFEELGNVAEFINGVAFKPDDWGDTGQPIIRIQNLTDPTKPYNRTRRTVETKYHVHPGDLLVSWSASLGVFEWTHPEVALVNQHIFRVLPHPERVDKRYLRHALEMALIEMQKHLHGATMQHVNRGEFLATRLFLPPIIEQQRIAAILDQAEVLRAKRRTALHTVEDLKRSLFLDMFGDPASNPRHWPKRPVGELAIKFSDGPFGSNLKSCHYTHSGVRVIRLQNIGVGHFLDRDRAYIAAEHFAKLRKHECVPGDVLIGTLGDPNLRACIQPAWLTSALNKADCVQARPNPEIATGEYLCGLLNEPSTERSARGRIHGQTRLRISMGQLRELPVPVPPVALQREFGNQVKALEGLRAMQQASEVRLNDLFSSLQHRAFRGEL
ncbi:MAG: restriction endonuclease subunit S [Gemmatimonadetes bacterium]|nr:restriction endonuclease subunit S [Gemmatimonadota bacterium]